MHGASVPKARWHRSRGRAYRGASSRPDHKYASTRIVCVASRTRDVNNTRSGVPLITAKKETPLIVVLTESSSFRVFAIAVALRNAWVFLFTHASILWLAACVFFSFRERDYCERFMVLTIVVVAVGLFLFFPTPAPRRTDWSECNFHNYKYRLGYALFSCHFCCLCKLAKNKFCKKTLPEKIFKVYIKKKVDCFMKFTAGYLKIAWLSKPYFSLISRLTFVNNVKTLQSLKKR